MLRKLPKSALGEAGASGELFIFDLDGVLTVAPDGPDDE